MTDNSIQSTTGVRLEAIPSSSKVLRVNTIRVAPLPISKLFTPSVDRDKHKFLGIQILHLIRNGKTNAASKLLQEDVNVNCRDSAGWSAMHHAARGGYVDLMIQLYEKGSEIHITDMSGETPLHKASRKGHVDALMILLSFGADITSTNQHGQTALDLAVKSLHITNVELLCSLGVEIMLQDWTWTTGELNPKQKEIANILLKYHALSPGYKHKSIVSKAIYVKPGDNVHIDDLDIEIINIEDTFFLYCSKMKQEYSTVTQVLTKGHDTVSDMYECKLWCNNRNILEMKTRVNAVLKCNESFSVVSPNGKIGRVECMETFNTTTDSSKHFSEVKITINVEKKKKVTFYVVKVTSPERFTITKEAMTLVPLAEPNAEIKIPSNTFGSEGELSLKFFDTREVNEEEKDENALMTNIIDIAMSDGQQPKQEIEMKIPIHYKMVPEDEVVILATSQEDPCSVDDWEVIDADKDESGKAATFKIKHFSIYAGSSKDKVKVDLPGVINALERSLNKQKKTEFFLISKWMNAETLLVVIEAAITRKVDNRIKSWIKLGYSPKSLRRSNEYSCRCGERFVFSFSGNLQEVSGEEDFALIFQSNRDNYRIFRMSSDDTENGLNGSVQIFQENEIKRVIPAKKKGLFSCCSPQKIKTRTSIERTSLQSMSYEIIKPPLVVKEPETENTSEPMISEQSLNKLGLFKYKVNATMKQKK